MTTQLEIRRWVASYLAEQMTLDELRGHLAPLRFDRQNPLSGEALAFLRPVELLLAEAASTEWTEAQVRERLVPYGAVVIQMQGAALEGISQTLVGVGGGQTPVTTPS